MPLICPLGSTPCFLRKHKAWSHEEILTPRGMDLMEEVFRDINLREYRINVTNCDTFHRVTVSRITSTNEYTVIIPFQETMGMRFGTCTCGKPKTDGVPCKHMAVIAMSSKIVGLTRTQIMPYWWTTEHWQQQYPMEVNCRTDISSLKTLKTMSNADDMLCYCPAWLTPKKAGRPKANVREKSLNDLIKESAKKKRNRRTKMFCKICEKFNHNTEDCWNNPANKKRKTTKQQQMSLEEDMSQSDEDGQEGKV